jgi:hypothetical protein
VNLLWNKDCPELSINGYLQVHHANAGWHFTLPLTSLQIHYSPSPYLSTPCSVATDSIVQGIINKIKYIVA